MKEELGFQQIVPVAQGTVLFKGTFLGRGDYRQGSL